MGGIGIGMTFRQPTPAAGGGETPWYLAGGVSAENCIAAYQAKGAASYAASKVNLANPGTHDLTDAVPPTWAIGSGWTFDGIASYLQTDITTAHIGRGTGTIIFGGTRLLDMDYSRYIGAAIVDNDDDYLYLGELSVYYDVLNSELVFSYTQNATIRPKTGAVTNGVFAMCGQDLYQDGIYVASSVNPSWPSGIDIPEIRLGSVAEYIILEDIWYYYYGDFDMQAAAFYNTSLSAEQVAAITTAMQAL